MLNLILDSEYFINLNYLKLLHILYKLAQVDQSIKFMDSFTDHMYKLLYLKFENK